MTFSKSGFNIELIWSPYICTVLKLAFNIQFYIGLVNSLKTGGFFHLFF